MREPKTAGVAAAAFYQITGMSIIENTLELNDEQDLTANPTDGITQVEQASKTDENAETMFFDPDNTLPLADTIKLALFWQRHQHLFEEGKRYLFGYPIDRNDATTREYLTKLCNSNINMVYQNAKITLALFDVKQPYQTFVPHLFS